MKAQELRIGNFVKSTNYYYEITEIGKKYCRMNDLGSADYDYNYPPFPLDKIMPIPITDEFFIELGIRKGNTLCFYSCDKLFSFEYKYNNYVGNDVLHLDEKPLPNIKYIHQLQNLFFGITGEELMIKNI